MILQPMQRIAPCICRSQLRNRLPCIYISRCRSDTQSNYSQVSGASSNWEDTDYDDRGDRASNATEAHQRHQWQQQQTQQQQQQTLQQQQQTLQPPDAERIPKKVTYAQQLVQSVFPQVISFVGPIRTFLFGFIRVFLLRTGRQTQVPEWGELEVLLRPREFGSEQSL